MVFTQSPSVSNNLKIPTYYLIFADLTKTKTKTKKKTKTECSKDPTCAMFLKGSRISNMTLTDWRLSFAKKNLRSYCTKKVKN